MIIIPAIDIIDGKVVRLRRGSYSEKKEYSLTPAEAAQGWADDGAEMLHVVDLDGARQGRLVNKETIRSIVDSVDIPVQAGGGIRTMDAAQELVDIGVARVIIGTRAAEDKDFITSAVARFGDKVTVSVDARDGFVMTKGWQEDSGLRASAFGRQLGSLGLGILLYTAVDADGTLSGPDIEGITVFLESTGVPVIASGGVSGIEDIISLSALQDKGLCGVIVGKALYEGKIRLAEAINACKKNNTLP